MAKYVVGAIVGGVVGFLLAGFLWQSDLRDAARAGVNLGFDTEKALWCAQISHATAQGHCDESWTKEVARVRGCKSEP